MSGLSLPQVAVLLLAGASAVWLPSQQSAPASSNPAQPPVTPRRFHRAAGGQLYVPAGVPIRMGIGLANSEGAPAAQESSEQSSTILKEGPNTLQFGDARVPVIADGTPPATTLSFDDSVHVESAGRIIFGPNPKLHLSAGDALSGVARTLISIDGRAFEELPPGGPAFATEGDHSLRFYSVDNVGNAEKVREFAFRLDSTAPETRTAVSGPNAGEVVGVGAAIALTAEDADAGVQAIRYAIDDSPEQAYARPLQLDPLPEGKHKLRFHAEDRVGNREPEKTLVFVVDRTAPEIAVTIRGPLHPDQGVRYISPQTDIEISARDQVAGPVPLRYKLNGAAADTPYAAPFRPPARSGNHRLQIVSDDPVQNRAQLFVDDLYVDLTPPRTDVEFSRPFFVRDGEPVLNPHGLIALNAIDLESGVAAVNYSLDGGPEQTYSQPFAIDAVGDHILKVSAVDRVGNREAPHEIRVRIEPPGEGPAPLPVMDAKRWYLHPRLGLVGPPGLPFEIRIAVSADEGAENYLVSPGLARQAAEPLAFTIPGKNTLSVALAPKAAGFGVSIDGAPPRTQLAVSGARRFESGGVAYFGPGLKVSLASEDDPSGISSGVWKTLYSIEGSAFATYTAPLEAFSREGAYTLRYYALDNVGNAESPHTFQFTLDSTPPRTRLELKGPHHASVVAPATRVALAASDNLSGVAQIVYRVDEGKESVYGEPFAVGPMQDGPHRLRYHAVDAVGNREEEHDWPFTVVATVGAPTYQVKGNSVERGGTIFTASGASIILKATEGDTVVYSLDGASPATYAAPIPAPEKGDHRLTFHAVDDLGNASPARTVNLSADRTPPGGRVHFDGPQLTREAYPIISGATRIVLEAEAGALGSATLEYSLDGRHWQTYTAPFSVKNSGSFDLLYRARNALSIQSQVQRQRIVVDARGPAIDVTYSAPVQTAAGTVKMDPGTLVFIAAEDSPAGLEKITCKIDDQPERIYRTPLSGFSPGKPHTVEIVAEDSLGNRTTKTVHLQIGEASR